MPIPTCPNCGKSLFEHGICVEVARWCGAVYRPTAFGITADDTAHTADDQVPTFDTDLVEPLAARWSCQACQEFLPDALVDTLAALPYIGPSDPLADLLFAPASTPPPTPSIGHVSNEFARALAFALTCPHNKAAWLELMTLAQLGRA